MHRQAGWRIALSLFTFLLILAGCVSPAPPREDPLAGLSFGKTQKADPSASVSFNDIKKEDFVLAMVISRNSKNALDYIEEARLLAQQLDSKPMEDDLDARPLIEGLTKLLKGSFSRIVRVENPIEAASEGADLISVVDLYVQIGRGAADSTQVDLKVIFTSLNGRVIKTFSGESKVKIPFGSLTPQFKVAANKALVNFGNSFRQSS